MINLEKIKKAINFCNYCINLGCNSEDRNNYNICIGVLKKQLPMKPISNSNWPGTYKCPTCDNEWRLNYDDDYKYCYNCGQKLDWSDVYND